MSRTVFCRKLQQDLPGLMAPPYPGEKGQDIFMNVSQQAWNDWQSHQTMLINEKQLSMANDEHRKYLQEQMDKYLSGENFDRAEGFVPTQDA